jgi:hypothetical protein
MQTRPACGTAGYAAPPSPAQHAQRTSESESVLRWRLKKEVLEFSSWRSWSVLVRLPLWMR